MYLLYQSVNDTCLVISFLFCSFTIFIFLFYLYYSSNNVCTFCKVLQRQRNPHLWIRVCTFVSIPKFSNISLIHPDLSDLSLRSTWKSEPEKIRTSIIEAIKLGYRLFDCAAAYSNEDVIGAAFKEAFEMGLVKREDLFISTKLWYWSVLFAESLFLHRCTDFEPENVRKAFNQSCKNLGVDYLDLYLVYQYRSCVVIVFRSTGLLNTRLFLRTRRGETPTTGSPSLSSTRDVPSPDWGMFLIFFSFDSWNLERMKKTWIEMEKLYKEVFVMISPLIRREKPRILVFPISLSRN